MRRRFQGSRRRMLLVACLCVAAVAATFAAEIPAAPQRVDETPLEEAEAQVRGCRAALDREMRIRRKASAYLALARKGRLIFYVAPGARLPVPTDVQAVSEALTLMVAAGELTPAELRKFIANLRAQARETIRSLARLEKKLQDREDELNHECARLIKERDALKVGGGGGSGPEPEAGAFPGGTATTMTLRIGGIMVTTDLKTNAQKPADVTIKGKSGTPLSGSVGLDGTLPPGWKVVVFHNGAGDIRLNTAAGGDFSLEAISSSFDAFTRPAAYICGTAPVPPLCSPGAQASISIDWDP